MEVVVRVDLDFSGAELPGILNAVEVDRADGTKLVLKSSSTWVKIVYVVYRWIQRMVLFGYTGSRYWWPNYCSSYEGVLGRVINVTGDLIDEAGEIKAEKRYPIHQPPPAHKDLSTVAEMLETGIKVIDLIQPVAKGGKVGLFGGAGVGKTVLIAN